MVGNSSWRAGWRIGTISYIDQGKIRVRATASDAADRIVDGSALRINSLNQYLYSYLGMSAKAVFKVVSIEEVESKLLDEELGKSTSRYVFTAIPLGEINDDGYMPGVVDIPMVGSPVYACGTNELTALFRAGKGDEIGCLAGIEDVIPLVDLDSIFSGHLAILGNTGSGKSTSSRLLLDAVAAKMEEIPCSIKPDALFVVFDLHGDYECLKRTPHRSHVVRMKHSGYHLAAGDFDIEDWSAVLDPSKRIQKPLLERAVRYSHLGEDGRKKLYAAFAYTAIRDTSLDSHAARKFQISKYYQHIQDDLDIGCIESKEYTLGRGENKSASCAADLLAFFNLNYGNLPPGLTEDLMHVLRAFITKEFMDVDVPDVDKIISSEKFRKPDEKVTINNVVDALGFVFAEEEVRGNRQARSYSEGLVTQLNNLRDRYSDNLFDVARGQSIVDVINESKGMLIIDVSEIVDETGLKLFSSFVARKLFERNRQDGCGRDKPVYIVFDEAHRYIREGDLLDDSIFNRIAREGRKFGVYLTVISQIPHELSRVVLSQTGAFVIHRIQNSLDLEFIRRNVPSITSDQIARLPNFAPGVAALLGSSIKIPLEVQVDGTFKDATPGASMFVD